MKATEIVATFILVLLLISFSYLLVEEIKLLVKEIKLRFKDKTPAVVYKFRMSPTSVQLHSALEDILAWGLGSSKYQQVDYTGKHDPRKFQWYSSRIRE